MTGLAGAAADLVGRTLAGAERLHGGDLSQVERLHFADGGTAVAKSGDWAGAEADMLRAITAAGVPAPRVLAVGKAVLVLEDLGADEGPGTAWRHMGEVLRQLHDTSGSGYGWPADHAFGAVPIPNAAHDDWPGFWAERRLLPSCKHLPANLARRVEALAGRLPELLPAAPKPSLLHGDLWTGNVMSRAGRVTGLIDPACYYGHAEVDLAMLTLFGNPGPAFWQAYGKPDPGAGARRKVYQLWPALVHLRLFGTGYRRLVERCLGST